MPVRRCLTQRLQLAGVEPKEEIHLRGGGPLPAAETQAVRPQHAPVTSRSRAAVAFAVTPILTWLGAVLAYGVPVALFEGPDSAMAVGALALDLLRALGPWAYAAEVVIGIPAYVTITRRRPLRFKYCVSVAAAAGAAASLAAPIRDVAIVVLAALLGAAAGLVFWTVYVFTGHTADVAA